MKKYIRYLIKLDKFRPQSLMWSHCNNGQGLWISTLGYKHMDHSRISKVLLKYGLRYDFDKELDSFDQYNRRTTTYFKVNARTK